MGIPFDAATLRFQDWWNIMAPRRPVAQAGEIPHAPTGWTPVGMPALAVMVLVQVVDHFGQALEALRPSVGDAHLEHGVADLG
jgi:hypothetical protein